MASCAFVCGCPGAVVAGEGQPGVVDIGWGRGPVVELECGESCCLAVVDGVDNGGCCLRGKVLGVVGDQAGDGQGVAVEVDGAGGAGLLGDGDELVKGRVAELSVDFGSGGDLPAVHGEGLGGSLDAWLGQGQGVGKVGG